MGSLVETLQDSNKRPQVIADCQILLDAEVADKRGISGKFVKLAFKTVKSFRPNMIGRAMDDLLDDFAAQVDPYWADCQSSGANPQAFFSSRRTEIANALLTITDERARNSPNPVLVKAYKSLRGKAVEHIGAAMPRFSSLVSKHAS
jgi:hypothetical protein